MRLSMIVAMDDNRLIGKENGLPWHLPADLQYFKKTTTGKAILMGRKTFESLGRPVPNRRNIIITHNREYKAEGCEVVNSIDEALNLTQADEEVMVIGGASFYEQTLPMIDRLYITKVDGEHEGDAYFPSFNEEQFIEISRETHLPDDKNQHTYHFIVLDRKV
jgi:dihydrofolate reductase